MKILGSIQKKKTLELRFVDLNHDEMNDTWWGLLLKVQTVPT